jgi:hypothetical protein
VALHSVINDIDQRGIIYAKSSQICAYANDIVIIARPREDVSVIYKESEEKAGKIGLEVNGTKYMILLTSYSRRKPQDLDRKETITKELQYNKLIN